MLYVSDSVLIHPQSTCRLQVARQEKLTVGLH